MRAHQVLQKCLPRSWGSMHALRRQTLSQAVQGLITGRRLTLIDLARSWPGAQRVRAPLKALDRLLSNRHLQAQREAWYAEMAGVLLRGARPIILVDWSDLKADRSWCLLRAAVPVQGTALPVLEMVFAGRDNGSPRAEKQFLRRLKALLPSAARPIIVTDAGFRTPWFQAVQALGWDWVGRLRGKASIKPAAHAPAASWVACRSLYAQASRKPRDLGLQQVTRGQQLLCRAVLYRGPIQGRQRRTRQGKRARNSTSLKCAARQRDPWLLLASPALSELSAQDLVGIYQRRMQIEASFRELKSSRYGQALEHSLTRRGQRLQILLLISALAGFVCWIAGLDSQATGTAERLMPIRCTRKLYSTQRIGREALLRQWPTSPSLRWMQLLRSLPQHVLQQMTVLP